MRKTSQMNFRHPKKFEPTPAKFIIGTLMLLFAITGCSDMPYTGSNLIDLEVNRYLVSTDGESVCFQDDLSQTCIKRPPEIQNFLDANNGPAVYIYPERRVYMLYHEGAPIFRAERAQLAPTSTDTQENASDDDPSTPNGQTENNNGNNNNNNNGGGNNGNNNNNNGGGNNGNNNNNNGGGNNGNNNNGGGNNGNNNNNNGGGNNGNNGNNNNNNGGGNNGNNNNGDGDNGDDGSEQTNGDNNNDGHGWIIWVYYPEEASPKNAPTLSESGVTVTINGNQLTDEDITGFAQFISGNGERGVQFFYPTQSAALLDLKIQIEGITSDDETVKFNINYLWNAQ